MQHISATFAKDNPEEVWEIAKQGPVEVHDGDVVVAVVVSPEDYWRLHLGHSRRIGLMAEQFKGFDAEELLNVDVTEAFQEYMS